MLRYPIITDAKLDHSVRWLLPHLSIVKAHVPSVTEPWRDKSGAMWLSYFPIILHMDLAPFGNSCFNYSI